LSLSFSFLNGYNSAKHYINSHCNPLTNSILFRQGALDNKKSPIKNLKQGEDRSSYCVLFLLKKWFTKRKY
jgi:hypothetical protein